RGGRKKQSHFMCVCVCVFGLPFFVLTPQHNPFKRGFFCNDESIRYPLREDTISYHVNVILMVVSSVPQVICGECLSVHMSNVSNQSSGAKYLVCVYKAVGSFVFGAAVSQSLTDVAKYSIGRLRPNFLAVCKPVWEHVNCGTGGLSFFSGHASFAMYCMLFLVLYIQARLRSEWARLLRPTIQFFLIATAVYVGLSRVSDYKHHWSDVLAGLLLGALAAVFTSTQWRCRTNRRRTQTYKKTPPMESPTVAWTDPKAPTTTLSRDKEALQDPSSYTGAKAAA
uniref:Phospholipid phosphatase 1 n=1 Tax=Takifugu rubripes TaxID=31033 RepID=A0A674P5I9_TAKRU